MNKKNIFTIAKYSLKEEFFPYLPNKTVAGMPKNYFSRILLLIFTYGFLAWIYYTTLSLSANLYLIQNMDSMYFAIYGIVLTLMIVAMYIPKILSSFFVKKDVDNYRTLPIREGELFVGKLIGNVLSFVDFFLFFIIEIIIYFNYRPFRLEVLILGILNFFTIVLIPYGIIVIFILLMKKFTNVDKYKNIIRFFGYLLMFVVIGAIYYFSMSGNNDEKSGYDGNAAMASNILLGIDGISNIFFNSKLFGLSLTGSTFEMIIYTLALFVISALILIMAYKLSDLYYYDSLEDRFTYQKRKKETYTKDASQKSQMVAILKRDIKNTFGNMVFLSGPITSSIIFTIMAGTSAKRVLENKEIIDLSSSVGLFRIFLAGLSLGILIWLNDNLSSTSLSREGRSFYLFQTLPINETEHFLARLLSQLILCSVFNIIISVVIAILVNLNIFGWISLFVGLSIASVITSLFGLFVGTKDIKINRTKPQEIVKGSFKQFIYYLIGMIIIALLIGLYVFLSNFSFINESIAATGIFILLTVIIVILTNLSLDAYKKGFRDI